uniref:Transposase n=1 Tax=Solanum demissum TaxID=50514 RepID=A0A191UMQ5_SOLDE|nr:transposase [Solanum demissum]
MAYLFFRFNFAFYNNHNLKLRRGLTIDHGGEPYIYKDLPWWNLIRDICPYLCWKLCVCTQGPRGYLTNVGGEGVDVDLGEEGETVNLGGEGEVVDLSGEGEAVNLGSEGVDVNIGEEGVDDNLGRDGVDDNLGGEGESDFLSSDSDLDIPSEDGSDIDEELRAFRQERRNKKQRNKATEFEEIPVGEAGGIDRGFEDIEKNKTDKYTGKLGGDEDYIDSSDCWSDDSDEQLNMDAVRGVDIPTRRRSKKVRYDEDCEVSIFELGMVFEGANQFRKAVADYAVEYMRQIKLRPNEKHRVKVKCKNANCKWLLYASIDRDSGDFIVKNYHPVHKCIPLNRNKLCNSKAKQRIMKENNMGDWNVEFARLYCRDPDYTRKGKAQVKDMIKQTNPGSSCRVKIDKETEPGKNLFVYFYVCFHAFKQGWLEGCRNIIGVDGCFLKGACKGELLVTVGKNGNNQMYPIAWEVVDTETNIVGAELLPNAEKRMCARHIWSNWHVNWKGEERRKQFWRCSKASFEVKFGEEVHAMSKLENNMCETFNSWILAARHKSIITMLEDIRHKMMNKHIDMIKFAETWISDIAPMARAILERNEELWMLRGIPYPHAICAYYYLNQDPDQHVEHWYKKETFLKAYIHFIQPIPNMRMWPETTNPSIEPPKPRKMPGRPGKKRRKSKDEPKKWGKLSRKGVKMTCTICKKTGHNKAVCARGEHFSTYKSRKFKPTKLFSNRSHKRPYNSASFAAAATGGNRRLATGFGVYSNPTTGAQVFNPGTSSEKILHGPTKLKSASPTNIDIVFKPRGLKWKGKDAVSTSQLQQMKANRKN